MNENEKKNGWLPILGYVALIVVLFIGIKVVFAGLGRAIPKTEDVQPQFTALDNREGQQVSYGLRLLTDEEAQSDEVRQWLGKAQEQAGPDTGAYWLVRLEEDDYLLCLPGQDRSLSASSFTATEERDPDGMIALVLRVRTPETGESVEPGSQLFCLRTQSNQWQGVRLRIIVDGREQAVNKLAEQNGQLYSTEEVYVGRDN